MAVAAFFATGFMFWVLAVAAFFAIMIFSEHDSNFWAAGVVIVFASIMHANGALTLFSDPLAFLMWAAAYFAIGAVWSSTKWWLLLLNRGEEFGELKLKWIKLYNALPNDPKNVLEPDYMKLDEDVASEIPLSRKKEFKMFLEDHGYLNGYSATRRTIVPNWRYCKERITTWILWWPTSFLWTMLNDPLVRLAKWIYQRLGGVYDRITNLVFGKFGDMSELDD